MPPGQVPADEDLQFSADIAAYFSKVSCCEDPGAENWVRLIALNDERTQLFTPFCLQARGSGKAEVSYTSPKHLKKVKGMKPGQVLVEKETVILGKEPGPDVIVTTSR